MPCVPEPIQFELPTLRAALSDAVEGVHAKHDTCFQDSLKDAEVQDWDTYTFFHSLPTKINKCKLETQGGRRVIARVNSKLSISSGVLEMPDSRHAVP